MTSRKTRTAVAALALGLTTVAAVAIEPPDMRQPDRDMKREMTREKDMQATRMLVFEAGTKMQGAKVENAEKQNLGTIDDMIVDRGSGRVTHLIMKAGSVLNLAGKTVVVPYSAFGWDNAEKRVTLTATKDEVKAWPEFDKKDWAEGPKTDMSLVRRVSTEYYETANAPWPPEGKFENKMAELKGKIKNSWRRTVGGREETVIVIVPEGATTEQEVILGPSWYNPGSANFYRETPVEVTTFKTTRDGREVVMAREVRVNGKTNTYYSKEGHAAWWPSASSRKEREALALSSPLILYSDIKGTTAYARDDKCGKVRDVIFECTTGRAAFLSIDPDQEFMGIGDQNRLVPFSLMTASTDGKVHLDANKQMITSAPTTPKDLTVLASDTDYKRIYASYDVMPPRFERWGR